MKCAIYTRVSTKDKCQDPLNHVDKLRKYCQKQGWEIAGEYIDLCSGKTANRPQFQALFDAAYRREFDVVLFWSLDRFSREGVLETLQHLQKFTSWNVAFKSYTEQFLDGTGAFRDAVPGSFHRPRASSGSEMHVYRGGDRQSVCPASCLWPWHIQHTFPAGIHKYLSAI